MSATEDLALSDSEHLGTTARADAPRCRLAIFHCYSLNVLHFLFGAAFNAISLHQIDLP
jgi:hypothetical protein